MAAPRKYPDELRDRSVRLVADLVEDEELQLSITAACTRWASSWASTATRCAAGSNRRRSTPAAALGSRPVIGRG